MVESHEHEPRNGPRTDVEVRLARLEERFSASEKATVLQAEEYKRRLHDLNGEYKRDKERQQEFVSMDKYEDKIQSMDMARMTAVQAEKEAREAALLRVDEKFEEYVQRWELRQREMDQTISTLSKAAAEARQIAENQGRQTREEANRAEQKQKEAAQENARRQTRNITIMGIVLAAIVGLANLLPALT